MDSIIKKAVEILEKGGLILYPSDTIWGVRCDATNPNAVEKVYKLKQRDTNRGLLILIHNPNLINQYINDVPEVAWDLIEVSDKPLSIIYPDAKNLATNLTNANGSVGIRVVKHPFCERLLHRFRKPIVSTSANISGNPYPKDFYDIDDTILDGVDYIVPAEFDESTRATPSGIIQLGKGGEIKVIRE